jgi:DnaJ-class molecular chaperone
MINHYKILNVPENATELQIKKAFRKLALKLHPDKTKSQNANEFLQIKNSYDILIDNNKRIIFDQQLYNIRNPKPQYSEINRGKLNETIHIKENFGSKIFNFILRIALVAIFITVTTYSCNFINNNIFGAKEIDKKENVNTFESKAKSDSLMEEDQKLEKELEATSEKQQTNGEIKF